jgi:hypothetical protein
LNYEIEKILESKVEEIQTLYLDFFKSDVIPYILEARVEVWIKKNPNLLSCWIDKVFNPKGDFVDKTMNSIISSFFFKDIKTSYAEVLYTK